MQKYIGTRIDEDDKKKFQTLAKGYKLNESSLLRLIVSVLADHPDLIKEIITEVHISAVRPDKL